MNRIFYSPWLTITLAIAGLAIGYTVMLAQNGKLTAMECTAEDHGAAHEMAEDSL